MLQVSLPDVMILSVLAKWLLLLGPYSDVSSSKDMQVDACRPLNQ